MQNPDIFKYLTVFRSLSDILCCLWKIVPDYNYFCKELLLRSFKMLGRIPSTPMYPQVLLSMYSSFRTYSDISSIIQECAHIYSEPCVSLPNSEPRHIQTPRCIYNTILNIFTKAPSCTFDTVLNAPLL